MSDPESFLVTAPVALLGAWPGDELRVVGDELVIVRRLPLSRWAPVLEESRVSLWPATERPRARTGGRG